jgi:thiosulfate dehydrogenase [quinone] large subunit
MSGEKCINNTWAILRISLGFVFFWAFIDKMFGLGFATCRDKATGVVTMMCDSAVINGGKATTGFLKFGTTGPFKGIFNAIAGNGIVEFLFMAGLLIIGIGLIFGILTNLATYGGAVLMVLMWLAVLPKENNPFMDEHIIYGLAMLLINWTKSANTWSVNEWWNSIGFVQKYKWLQ